WGRSRGACGATALAPSPASVGRGRSARRGFFGSLPRVRGRVGWGHRSTGTGMPRRGPGGRRPGRPASGGRGGRAARLLWLPPPRAGEGWGGGIGAAGQGRLSADQATPIPAVPRKRGKGQRLAANSFGSLPRGEGWGGGIGARERGCHSEGQAAPIPASPPPQAGEGVARESGAPAWSWNLRAASAAAHPPLEARGAAAHRQLELADGGDALLGQAVRGLV